MKLNLNKFLIIELESGKIIQQNIDINGAFSMLYCLILKLFE